VSSAFSACAFSFSSSARTAARCTITISIETPRGDVASGFSVYVFDVRRP
jgi:hypothetical protein